VVGVVQPTAWFSDEEAQREAAPICYLIVHICPSASHGLTPSATSSLFPEASSMSRLTVSRLPLECAALVRGLPLLWLKL
jgi:hypothetical protein